MRVTLVYPPGLCLPNQLYYALPMLAGSLRRAGHEPHIVDLNVLAANLLLDAERSERLVEEFRTLSLRGVQAAARRAELGGHFDAVAARLRCGEAARRVLQDPVAFYDARQARDAFWTVVDVLAGFYQLEERLSPYHDEFTERLLANQREDRWTAVGALWDDGLLDAVFADDPQVVGISLMFPEQSVEAIRLARQIRARDPHVHIALGGPMVSRRPERFFEGGWVFDFVDSVILGEAETALVELCDALEGRLALDDVRHLVRRDGAGKVRHAPRMGILEELDELPIPDYSTVDMSLWLQPEPIHPLMTSRGCYWGKCTFCSIGYRENYRSVSKEKLREDVLGVVAQGGRRFQLHDSSIPPKNARHLAEIVVEEGLDVAWAGWMKFESRFKDPGYCETLARGGCKSLQMGFESSDQRLLDLMNKGYRHEDLLTMLRNIRSAGISTELLWFIGFPSQTRRDVFDSARFLWRHRDLFGLASFISEFLLLPDSEVYRQPERFGVTIVDELDGRISYAVESGLTMDEALELKQMLAGTSNRTLTCNGCHLLHLAKNGLDLSALSRPMELPAEIVAEPASGG